MSDLHNDTAKPGAKPAYSPPRVVRLGDLNEGIGACSTGSGFVAPPLVNCTPGNSHTGYCNIDGSTPGTTCIFQGLTAHVFCQGSGNTNTGGDCQASGNGV